MKQLIILSILSLSLFFIGCNEDSNLNTEPTDLDKLGSYGDVPENLEKGRRYAEFEITMENLTPLTHFPASQPLSPPVVATHNRRIHLFQKYEYASPELAQIAEDAFNGPMLALLNNSPLVYDVVVGSNAPIFPGESATFSIKTTLPFNKISLVSMLVNTNDAFTGIDAASLPRRGSKSYYLYAYDAGSEYNTESKAHIPGPCCGNAFQRVPTNEKIMPHMGIKGTGDLSKATYGWEGHAAKLTITRIR